MNIAIIGTGYFAQKLAKQLNDFDKKNSYYFYNTSENKLDKIKYFLHLPFIDTVYSVTASISGGGALKAALKFNKNIVQHFIGSDVLTSIDEIKNNRVNQELVQKSHFYCEIEWIQSELADIGIKADIASIAVYEKEVAPKKPKTFSVLTYMGKAKEEFYGMSDFVKLAEAFPAVEFKIAAVDQCEKELPKNITLLGWADMDKEFQKCVCYVRNAKHDGLAFSILEALGYGRAVFYNYDFPHVNYFTTADELIALVKAVKDEFDHNQWDIDYDAITFIKEKYSKEDVLGNLVNILTDFGNK
jgi:hypothetical protein